jgi:hypothetical protein
MGIEYTLVNTRNKTLYELGKGVWSIILNPLEEELPCFLYRETFLEYVDQYLKENSSSYWFEHIEDRQEWLAYHKQIAHIIFDFMDGFDPEKDFRITNDCDDSNREVRDAGYIYLGSRYIGMPDYNEYIHELNKHLRAKIDLSSIDFTIPMIRLRKLLSFM